MRSNRHPRRPAPEKESMLLGVGLDGDGETRITRGKELLLVGGTSETHEAMQERAIRFREELEKRYDSIAEIRTVEELREIADRAGM